MAKITERNEKPDNEIILYQTADGNTKIDVRLENETVWLNQAQMVELFQTTKQNTQFRIWATQRLKEYIIKGFTLDDERMKSEGQIRYFDELVAERAVAIEKNMGLTSWQGEKIRKSDVGIAKNYLIQGELSQLNLLVEQFLAFAENQARQKKVMYMNDWIKKLNDILTINENEILEHAGKISHELAVKLAETEFDKYNTKRLIAEDIKALDNLDIELKQLKAKNSIKKK